MAAKGRKPLPTALKVLEGDRGKGRRPINQNEPAPPQKNVKYPDWLMPEAKKEWKRLAPCGISLRAFRTAFRQGIHHFLYAVQERGMGSPAWPRDFRRIDF